MKRTLAMVLGGLLCAAQGWSADSQRIELPWNELGPRIGNNKVSMALPGGVYIEGRIREVAPEGLRMKISKTSDSKAQPKGVQVIPRGSISVLHVTEYRKLGRLVGALGAAGATAGIAAGSYPDLYEGPAVIAVPAVVAAGTIGAGVAGYFIGKRIDKREVEIRIVR
jgi:hypothetical protein